MSCSFLKPIEIARGVFVLCLMALSTVSQAQHAVTLHIGDEAPKLEYSKWLKGAPIKSYEKGRLYALEFWATWCSPCKAVMPHLSELAKKYEKEVTIVGVNIWEKVGDKPYESSLPNVTKFVNGMGGKMAYSVIADNNAQQMGDNWMKAAGQYGIPSTFLLKDGKILWIGHPSNLDSTIQLVLTGKFDVAAYKEKFEARGKKEEEAMAKAKQAFEPIDQARKAGNYTLMLSLIDSAIVQQPSYAEVLNFMKFTTMLDHVNADSAIEFAKVLLSQKQMSGASVANEISTRDGLKKESYMYAADLFNRAITIPGVILPMLYNRLAATYAKAGDYKSAVDNQQKAIATAKVAVKEDKYPGTIMEFTVTDYEKELSEYKKRLN